MNPKAVQLQVADIFESVNLRDATYDMHCGSSPEVSTSKKFPVGHNEAPFEFRIYGVHVWHWNTAKRASSM